MTPNTKTKNLLIWGAALLLSLFLAFVGSWVEQASTIPAEQPINWRSVWIDVGKALLAIAPVVAAGFNLPRFGREEVSSRVSNLGKEEAIARLDTPPIDSVQPTTPAELANAVIPHINIDALANAVINENRRRQLVERFPNGPISEKINQQIP